MPQALETQVFTLNPPSHAIKSDALKQLLSHAIKPDALKQLLHDVDTFPGDPGDVTTSTSRCDFPSHQTSTQNRTAPHAAIHGT